MPVLITGATGLVGRALAARLRAEDAQVRAYVRRDDPALRALGLHVAVGAIDDVQRLESALTRVHTIVHLVGATWPERGVTYDFLNRESTECAVIAARAADVRRFLFLSFLGAEPSAHNEFLAAKGKAEQHIAESGLEYAIFRCAPVAEGLVRTFERLGRGGLLGIPRGSHLITPVRLQVVVEALVAADSRDQEIRDTFDLGGAETMTVREAAERLGTAVVKAARFSGAPRALLDLYRRDLVADSGPAIEHFGLRA